MNDPVFGLSDQNLIDLLEKHVLNSGGLAIKAGSNVAAKTASAVYYFIGGKLYTKAAGDMAALSGTITNGKVNVFVFTVNAAGTVATAMGTEGATIDAVVFPTTPAASAVIGFVYLTPANVNFVGGTSFLDGANITAVYVNAVPPMRFA